jgi:outer membrane protein OmpA-like peptidoglycan-associated protein
MIHSGDTGVLRDIRGGRASPAASPDRFDELRELLLGREQSQIGRLAERIENPALRVKDVSEVLPAAMLRSAHEGDRLARAMTPAVEAALQASIKRDPAPVANALYPVIGAAIRKAMAETFSRFVQAFNYALEHTFSPRGIRWRLEAWRSGRSFAEVVLWHTLIFRVEQVLLVHRPSGLLLLHATAPGVEAANQDVISGMLSAIQDFMRDSFNAGPGEHLETVQIGALNLWIETGPHATIAAMVRGEPPVEFRQALQRALEGIHREESTALDGFAGDARRFESVRPWLESCLQCQSREQPRRGLSPSGIAVCLLLLGALLLWGAIRWRERSREQALIGLLRAQHGLVVSDVSHRSGKLRISGWKDALSPNPVLFVSQAGLGANEVEFNWEPFFGLTSDLVLRRAKARLEPPAGVEMQFQSGTLVLSGSAPSSWAHGAEQRALLIPGIENVDTAGLRFEDPLENELSRLRRSVEELRILFEHDHSSSTSAETDSVLGALSKAVADLRELAGRSGAKAVVAIKGHTDPTGSETHNGKLRLRRAEWVRQQLLAAGVPNDFLRLVDSEADGNEDSRGPGALTNRCVTFSLLWEK